MRSLQEAPLNTPALRGLPEHPGLPLLLGCRLPPELTPLSSVVFLSFPPPSCPSHHPPWPPPCQVLSLSGLGDNYVSSKQVMGPILHQPHRNEVL